MMEVNFWFRFVVAVLATWRVTHLVASEDGPADLIVRFRARLGRRFAGSLMDCFYCLSVWIAAPAALFVSRRFLGWLFAWLAISGAACLLERLGQEPVVIRPLSPPEERESNDVLRTETIGAADELNAGNHGDTGGEDAIFDAQFDVQSDNKSGVQFDDRLSPKFGPKLGNDPAKRV
jgi:Protein of unknown function (DUF1360)